MNQYFYNKNNDCSNIGYDSNDKYAFDPLLSIG